MRKKWTLFVKIQVLVVAILLILYIAVELTIFGFVGQQMQQRFVDDVKNTVILTQKNIETVFSGANASVSFLAQEFSDMVRDDDMIEEMIYHVGASNENIMNTFIAYSDGTWIISPPSDSLPDNFDPRGREWYLRAFRSAGVKWSDPYVDMVTNERVVTISIYSRMKDVESVVGMDITLTDLTNLVNLIDISENGIVVLLNNNNRIIASNDLTKIDLKMDAFNDPELMANSIVTGELYTSEGLYYVRRLNESEMRLMAFIPHRDIAGTTRAAQIVVTVVITIVLIGAIVISQGIMRRVMRPLTALKEVMIRSKSKGEVILIDEQNNDEINTVIRAYNALAYDINAQNEEIKRMAYSDDLTGLPNRASFIKQTTEWIENHDKVAMFYLDLDNFKYVNDTYGHAYGDIVLKMLAKALTEFCDENSFVARLSGDEFGILVSDYESDRGLETIAHNMLHLIRRPMYLESLEFSLTGSIGVSRYPDDSADYETLMSNADIAMYEAKNKTKDNYLIFNNEVRHDFIKQIYLETRLIQSIDKGELSVVYQPIIDLKSKKISGFEVLSRWVDSELGSIYPDVFIPIAERNHFINQIGRFALEQSVGLGKRLFEEHGSYYEINVNVSVVQLHVDGFVDEVLEILDINKYPTRFLNLEITESITLESDEHIMMKLAYLRKKGVQISLDDFGTGYSSLNHLTDLSLTHIKLDRQLILKAGQSQEIFQLMKGIVEFAHTMYFKVVAEGIEDAEMENMVSQMHADFAQGYMYDKPLYEEQLIARLKEEWQSGKK